MSTTSSRLLELAGVNSVVISRIRHLDLTNRVNLAEARVTDAGSFIDILTCPCYIEGRGIILTRGKKFKIYQADVKGVRVLYTLSEGMSHFVTGV